MHSWTYPGLQAGTTAVVEHTEAVRSGRRGPVRFADPAAWLVLDAIAEVLRIGDSEQLHGEDRAIPGIGVIGISEQATADTLHRCAQDLAESNLSPLRFVAASPGTLIGLSCSHFGFTGPSLLLTMPIAAARGTALAIAGHWLLGPQPAARAVAMTSYSLTPEGAHRAECRWFEPLTQSQRDVET